MGYHSVAAVFLSWLGLSVVGVLLLGAIARRLKGGGR